MILAMIFFVLLFIVLTMYLWNWLVPDLFNGPQITFWQSAGLLLLAKILFGFGSKGGGWKKYGGRKHKDLSPQEKEALKRRFMEKCGWVEETKSEIIEEKPDDFDEAKPKRGYGEG